MLIVNFVLCNNQFQAMVHELIGVEDNKVDLRNIGKVPKDQQVFTFAFSFFIF